MPPYRTTGCRNPSASGKSTPHCASVRAPTIWPSMKFPSRPIPIRNEPGTTTASKREQGIDQCEVGDRSSRSKKHPVRCQPPKPVCRNQGRVRPVEGPLIECNFDEARPDQNAHHNEKALECRPLWE